MTEAVSRPISNPEIAMLLRYLKSQRQHILGILEGLDDAALRRPILPSGWSCLGLVQHLAIDVERFWFRAVIAGEREVIDSLDSVGNAWIVADGVAAATVFALYREESARTDAIIAAAAPDAAPAWWPTGLFGDWHPENVRRVILHAMTETATHAGHLDVVRELINGRRWLVLTD